MRLWCTAGSRLETPTVLQKMFPNTHTHARTHSLWVKPNNRNPSADLVSLWRSPSAASQSQQHDWILPQHNRTGICFFFFCSSWIWSLLMRDLTAVCPYRRQRGVVWGWAQLWSPSLSLSLSFSTLVFIPTGSLQTGTGLQKKWLW